MSTCSRVLAATSELMRVKSDSECGAAIVIGENDGLPSAWQLKNVAQL